jgi:photosystem II stability/assembly factor-like uncharacterized protein
MAELERAGRAVRDSVVGSPEPNERVLVRARNIVRRRRVMTVGSISTAVIFASVGIALAANGGNGVGVHTIGPAASSTTHTLVTTHVVPTSPTTPGSREAVDVRPMPALAFADSLHGWRTDPLLEAAVDRTTDGGRTWTTQLHYATGDSVNGVVAVDDHHAFALITYCCDGSRSQLMRTTDGAHWQQAHGAGLRDPLEYVAFVDASHGWGLSRYGDLVSTADGGDHWRATRRPVQSAVTVCLSARGRGWVATATTVFRSVDDGVTWARQAAVPVGGGSDVELVCHGAHAAYASFGIGANQYIGGFLRTDDGGAHWRVLTEDRNGSAATVTAPGFPSLQTRGDPTAMSADGTLVFITGCEVCEPNRNWVVVASPAGRFIEGLFDGNPANNRTTLAAQALDTRHVFAEVQSTPVSGAGPRPVSLYASTDGGQTWQRRWTGQ